MGFFNLSIEEEFGSTWGRVCLSDLDSSAIYSSAIYSSAIDSSAIKKSAIYFPSDLGTYYSC